MSRLHRSCIYSLFRRSLCTQVYLLHHYHNCMFPLRPSKLSHATPRSFTVDEPPYHSYAIVIKAMFTIQALLQAVLCATKEDITQF